MQMNKLIRVLKNPLWLIVFFNNRGIHLFNDRDYVKLLYRLTFGKKLNLDNPKTFNEKMQWLKIYDRKSQYSMMVDKYEAKKYVASIIGEKYIIPTYGIYNSFDEINFDSLPDEFVIKCTHDSGGLIIVRNKNQFDKNKARKKINKCLKRNFYWIEREWPYKNVKPRIIIEKYMEDKNSNDMRDYKFFCFNGEPKLMYLSEGLENHSTARISFYDMNFNVTDCKRRDYELLDYTPSIPNTFEKMKKFATILSKDIPHLRVDFYEINGKLYFGELTFFTCGGYVPFEDEKWDKQLGDYIKLPITKK